MSKPRTGPVAEPAVMVPYLHRLLASNDITQALQVAVSHVVDLLGCEVSWAGLIDAGYLVMGAHHGLVSSEMASAWRLRVGEGIGGRAAAERRPQTSRDYRHDSRRERLLKRLIDDEGIHATMAVPLLSADTALGVLYAARRRPHPWTGTEVRLLEEVAHDLAVRLHRLDVEGRHAAQAREAEQRFRRALHGQHVCARLAGNLTGQADAGVALDMLALEVGGRIELRRPDGRLLHSAGELGQGNPRTVSRSEIAGTDGLILVVVRTGDLDDVGRAMIDLAVGMFRLQFLRIREGDRTTERLSGELFDRLLTGRISDPEAFRRRMALMGVSVAARAQVLVAGPTRPDAPAGALNRLADTLQRTLAGCVTTERAGRLVAVVDLAGRSTTALREQLSAVLRQGHGHDVVIGAGRICTELIDFSMSYDEARAACELGRRGAPPGTSPQARVVSAHDLGILGVASLPAAHLRTTVRDLLGPLIDSDEQRATDFVATLRAYLVHDRHLAATAAALHVHYNTVRNRIARIETLLGIDVRDVDDRFRLETALRMHALTHALGYTAPAPLSRHDSAGPPRCHGAPCGEVGHARHAGAPSEKRAP
ncbi:helix-turn-helix domain-containing protein (plasmid) [Embleya sp. NBC_00888]|uniref:helix-turn-helix domain-containing protein n=1 Tax=Embleya sp. NBC_00888 TaxID=2975960 RepID=UPI002F915655|nr:helix-turn-helix domain-containing protein [Embleya sp. NBC_00888]